MNDDPFFEVCEECGRHIVKAGHDPDCPNADDCSLKSATEHTEDDS